MTEFTVEATVAAVTDGDWSRLHQIIDLVPGTILLEDPEAPVLVFPVQADDPMKAIMFVDGIAKLVDLEITAGSVKPAPEADFDVEDDSDVSESGTDAERAVNEWVESVPSFKGRVTRDGTVECVS